MHVQRMRNRRAIQQALKALPKNYELAARELKKLARDAEALDRLTDAMERSESDFDRVLSHLIVGCLTPFFGQGKEMKEIYLSLASAASDGGADDH